MRSLWITNGKIYLRPGERERAGHGDHERPEWLNTLVTAPAVAPIRYQHPRAEHASEMREMRDALLRAGDTEIKLQRAIENDEHPRGHGDRRDQQYDRPTRKVK